MRVQDTHQIPGDEDRVAEREQDDEDSEGLRDVGEGGDHASWMGGSQTTTQTVQRPRGRAARRRAGGGGGGRPVLLSRTHRVMIATCSSLAASCFGSVFHDTYPPLTYLHLSTYLPSHSLFRAREAHQCVCERALTDQRTASSHAQGVYKYGYARATPRKEFQTTAS